MAAIGSWEWGIASGRVDWSDELYRIFRVCAEEFDPTYEAFMGFIHPDDRPGVEAATERALGEHSFFEWEARIVRPDGETRMLHTYAEVILDESGAPAILRGSAQDVTERKVAEGAQRQSELRYRQIVETANEGIWMIDAQGKTTFANARMAEMLGCSDAELLSRSFLDFTDEAGAQEALERFQQGADGTEDVHDFRFIRKDGSELWALLATNQLTNESGEYTGALAMVADITDRVRVQQESASLERQLQRGQRLESVGQLAGGIAHDFNNLLAVILSYATFASEELEEGHVAAGDVAEISRAADRAAALTRQLLIFSRRETVRPEVVVLNEVVGDVERMLARTLGEHVELQTDLAADLWPTLVDVAQMEQVLVNLAVNARDAMPEGGVLTVATRNVTLDETYAEQQLDARPGRYVHLSVTDTGEGMEQSTVDQAFEPFFTTKALGEGTGLGLATAYGVVTQAGGHIRLYSEPGRGTSAQMHLPACDAPAAADHDHSRSETLTGGAGETVLVVEDEDAMREVTRRILTHHNYSVVTADGPLEALRICDQHPCKIDLLLTDVVMPKMLGPELSRRIAALRPETKIAYMSGYSGKVQALNDAAAEVLEKPFTATALLEAVRQALNGDVVS